MDLISISQAFEQWQELAATIPADDVPMLSESWNNYTDSLCKGGDLSALQYHYAPAYDDPMPGNGTAHDRLAGDRAFVLDAMGVAVNSRQVDSRPGADQWDRHATHWRVTIKRGGESFTTHYSMGSALRGDPELQDVVHCLLTDAEYGGESFADWCDNMGDNPDSRRAYSAWEACKRTAASLARLFSPSELEELREMFGGY